MKMKKLICAMLCLSMMAGFVSVDAKADTPNDKKNVNRAIEINTNKPVTETATVESPAVESAKPTATPVATPVVPSAGKITVDSEEAFSVKVDASEKTCVITGYKGNLAVTTLYIPSKIDENTVTGVESGVFATCPYLKNVIVAGDVELKGNSMFSAKGVEIWGKSTGKAAAYATAAGLVFHPLDGSTTISSKKAATLNKATITWSAVNNAVSYNLYRKSGKGKYKMYKNVTGLSYTNEKLGAGTTYTYKVCPVFKSADGEVIEGLASKTVSVSMKPAKVKKLKAHGVRGGIQVRWARNKNATGYQVFMKVHVKGFKTKFNRVKTIKKNKVTGYRCKMLVRGMKYSYKVRAFKTVKGKKIYGPFVTTSARAK